MNTFIYTPHTPTQIKQLDILKQSLHEDRSTLIGEYNTIGCKTKITFICGNCGNSGSKSFHQITKVSGALCHKCTQEVRVENSKNKLLETEGITNISQRASVKEKKRNNALANGIIMNKLEWMKKISSTGLDNVWEYLFEKIDGYDKPHKMRHIKCGNIAEKSPRSHLTQDNINTKGQGCITCYNNSKRFTKELFIEKGIERYGNRFKYDNVPDIIPNNHTLLALSCTEHGPFETTYSTHLNSAGGCLPCSNHMNTKHNILEKYSKSIQDNGVDIDLSLYKDNDIITLSTKILCTCTKKAKHRKWHAMISNLMKGSGCPSCASNGCSKRQIEWLRYLEKDIPDIQHYMNKGEYKIDNYSADGYSESLNTVFEFHGCFWHGCNLCYDSSDINPINKKTYAELYTETLKKKNYIESKGYLYKEIWEHEWKKDRQSYIEDQKKQSTLTSKPSLAAPPSSP